MAAQSERDKEALRVRLREQLNLILETRETARGLGESQPVASNASSAGRQQNRRVALIVSGEAIGTP